MAFKSWTTAVLLLTGALFASAAVGQDQPKPAKPPEMPKPAEAGKPALTSEDATALIAIIRSRSTPDQPAPKVPENLLVPSQLPLIVTFYSTDGPVQQTEFGSSLNESAEKAGDALIAKLSKSGHALWGVLELNVVVSRKTLAERNRLVFLREFDPGIQGLAHHSKRGTAYFTPTTLFRNWPTLEGPNADVVKSVYYAQESEAVPPTESAELLGTLDFVEKWPLGPVVPVYRGNVLLPPPNARDVADAMFHVGEWFMHLQQEDGSFRPDYFPADRTSEKEYRLADHLRATVAITLLHRLTGDSHIAEVRDRALEYSYQPQFAETDRRRGLFYLSADKDEITPTALLLTALCYRAMAEPTPTADGRMTGLGASLCALVAPDGRLYPSLNSASEQRPPYIGNGIAYAETLLALDLLQRVSPTPERREVIGHVADLLESFPPDVRIMADPRIMGYVGEAMAEHYKVSNKEKHAKAVLKIGAALLGAQASSEKPFDGLQGRAAFADYAGGFAEGKLSPDTFTTAADTTGLCAAYEISILTNQKKEQYSVPIRNGTRFLMNMQYRPENTFYLDQRDRLLGAFRRNPENLGLNLGATAESLRALMAASTVIRETVANDENRGTTGRSADGDAKSPEKPAPH